MAIIAIFLLNRLHFENFALTKKSLRTTITKRILFEINLLFLSDEQSSRKTCRNLAPHGHFGQLVGAAVFFYFYVKNIVYIYHYFDNKMKRSYLHILITLYDKN
jgi:hypothetical protein